MHVCHFCETSVEGAYFRNIAKGLTERGVRVSVMELGEHKPPAWLGEVPGVEYFSLGVTSKLLYPLAAVRLAWMLKREKVDILHTHLYYSGLISILSKAMQRRSVVALMRHHTGVVRMLGTRAHVALDKWMAEHADRMLAASEATRVYMREVDGIKREIDVVYLGFDFDTLAPDQDARRRVRGEFEYADENFVIGYIGNFAPGKGHRQLVEAFGKIEREIPKARLLILGEGRLDEVDEAVERMGSAGKITFAGWRPDVAACINAMDVFVQPSLSEAFSQVLIEAMGIGLPVVATKVGAAHEVIDDGKNGFLIEPDEPDAIYRATVHLFAQPEKRKSIGYAAREAVCRRFTVERMVETQLNLYQSWLRGGQT
jgi:glycosyltransferase involved in cell wall biosynthesis